MKIFSDANPMQVLRTKTRGVGTESYRAPEVNSGLGYDPSFADVWSLGVMLFFFVSHVKTKTGKCNCTCLSVKPFADLFELSSYALLNLYIKL